jgi:hypothetical protein
LRPAVTAALTILVVAVSSSAVVAQDLYTPQGLLPVRNFQPVQGLFLHQEGDVATVLAPGELVTRFQGAETSTILQESNSNNSAILKLNQLRTALDVRYGVFTHTEAGLNVAAIYNNSGGLDSLITAVEHAFDKAAPIRERLKNSGFAYNVMRNGQVLVHGTNEQLGLADIMLYAKTQLLNEGNLTPAVAIRFAVKIPTGERNRGFGTGETDVGLGLAAQKRLFDRLVVYENLNSVFPTGDYFGLHLRPYLTSLTGLEFMVTRKFSVTGQFDYYQSPFHATGLRMLDRNVAEIVLALGYRFTPHWLWQLYGVENVNITKESAADFTLATVLTYRFSDS